MIPYHRPMPIQLNYTRIEEIINSGMLTNNKYCRLLESRIRELYGVEYVLTTSSCTMALLISLQAAKQLHRLREVHTPSFAWFSSKWGIEAAGLIPYFEDVNRATWLMDTKYKYECAVPVHTFGNIGTNPADVVIYDGAHALGAKIRDFGDATVISLAPTKVVTSGEGGLILTNRQDLYEKMEFLRNKTCRMPELSALYGLTTLEYLPQVLNFKENCYNFYKTHIKGQFQKIPYNSCLNTIGYLSPSSRIPDSMETRQYYEPLMKGFPNTDYIYEHITCLPSWYGVDYMAVTGMLTTQIKPIEVYPYWT